jgi:dephospho-CoA kinase
LWRVALRNKSFSNSTARHLIRIIHHPQLRSSFQVQGVER